MGVCADVQAETVRLMIEAAMDMAEEMPRFIP